MAKKNAFATAKVVGSVKAAKKETEAVASLGGLAKYAAACALEKAVKAIKTRYESTVKAAGYERFVETGVLTGTVPANYKAAEDKAEASVQLKKRINTSALTAEEQVLCEMHKVPTEVIPGAFFINPAYAGMEDLMEKVGQAIAKVSGVPDDFILKKEDVVVASEEGIAAIFASKNKELIETLLPIQTTVAFRTSTSLDMEGAFKLVEDDLFEKAEQGAA